MRVWRLESISKTNIFLGTLGYNEDKIKYKSEAEEIKFSIRSFYMRYNNSNNS